MRRFTRMAGGVLLLTVSAMATGAAVNAMPMHERKEVAGLAIVTQGDVDDIIQALNAYAAAITAMDIDAVGEWVTEDLLVFEGAGVNRGWADYRDHHLGRELEMFDAIDYQFSDIEAEADGNLGWANFRYSVHIEMPERVTDSGGVGTAVLVKSGDGRWRLRHLHTTPERRRQ